MVVEPLTASSAATPAPRRVMPTVDMSVFPASHTSLTVPTQFIKSDIKKLGFSIDSIVGHSAPRPQSPGVSPPASPCDVKPRLSPSPPARCSPRDRSRSPPRPRSVSPPTSPQSSLYRPTPTSLPSSPALTAHHLLQDQLAQLKAFYDAKGAGMGPSLGGPGGGAGLLPPGLAQHLGPASLPGLLPRPGPPSSLPPFLGLPGAGGQFPGSPLGPHPAPIPREYPLHPWFINRHRFPLGKLTKFKLTEILRVTVNRILSEAPQRCCG